MVDVLTSTKYVVDNSRNVAIKSDEIKKFCEKLKEDDLSTSQLNLFHYEWDKRHLIQIVFLFNTINFCFWAEKRKSKWTVKIAGEELDGSTALFRCLEEAVKQNQDLLRGDCLADMTLGHLRRITKGNTSIPLIKKRLDCLKEAGKVIEREFGNSFYGVYQKSNNDAWELTKLAVENFPRFNDTAEYQGHTVAFYKRAQLNAKMVSDVLVRLGEESLSSLDNLTAFADYKIPQILRSLGILDYSKSLADRIDKYEIIKSGLSEEVEIRSNAIWAVELIRQQLRQKFPFVTASHIDSMLWLKSQDSKEMKPYHRTYTIAY